MAQYFFTYTFHSLILLLLSIQILLLLPVNSEKIYTTKESEAIKQFRSLVGPNLYKSYMRTDEYLIRWIRDQNFDLKKAESKLLNSFKWRKSNNIDSLLKENLFDIFKQCRYDISGRDKIGRPIVTMEVGTCPIRKIILQGNGDRINRAIWQVFERAVNAIQIAQAEGKNVTDIIAIVNLNSLNLREHMCINCLPYITNLFVLYENHYPQYIFSLNAINTPRIFERLLNIIQPLMSEDLQSRLHIYGHNRLEWMNYILKHVSPDQLEMKYGGTRKEQKFSYI